MKKLLLYSLTCVLLISTICITSAVSIMLPTRHKPPFVPNYYYCFVDNMIEQTDSIEIYQLRQNPGKFSKEKLKILEAFQNKNCLRKFESTNLEYNTGCNAEYVIIGKQPKIIKIEAYGRNGVKPSTQELKACKQNLIKALEKKYDTTIDLKKDVFLSPYSI